jgi:Synergist-CTERM protein sorting domain-containing protein
MGAAILAGVLLSIGGGISWGAGPTTVFAGVPANGQFNSGAMDASYIGTKSATVKLYYRADKPAAVTLPMITAGFNVQGSGFGGYGRIGFALDAQTSAPWLSNSSVPPDPEVQPDGSFISPAYFRRMSSEPYAEERLHIYMRVVETGERIAGSELVLTVIPTPVSLPVTLAPVTLYTAADYRYLGEESDKGVAAKIVAGNNQFAVRDMSLAAKEGGRTVSLENGNVWSPANGVTAASNVDGSSIVFRTSAAGGPTEVEPAETFTISGTGVFVINDGFASVYGFERSTLQGTIRRETLEIASFSLQVLDGGSIEVGVSGPVSFQAGVGASSAIAITSTPSNLEIADIQIANAGGADPSSSKELNGLVITVDPATGRVTFSGTPTSEAPETTYTIIATTSDGRTLTTDLTVAIAPGEVYRASFSPSSFGGDFDDDSPFWTAGSDVGSVSSTLTIRDSEGNPANDVPVTFTLQDKDGQEIGDVWNGLQIRADEATKTVTITGTPDKPLDERIYVQVTPAYGQVSPNPVSFKINVDPDVDYTLTTDPQTLTLPVGESASVNIELFTSPVYPRDMIPRSLSIDGGDSAGPATTEWNGLTITAMENLVTNKCWLAVTGEAQREETREFTIHPGRGDNMTDAKVTITARVPEPAPDPEPEPDPAPEPEPDPDPAPDPEPDPVPEPEPGPDPDPEPAPDPAPAPEPKTPSLVISDPVIIVDGDEGKKEVDQPAVGQPTQIVYNVSFDVNVDIQVVNVQLPNGDSVEATPLSENTAPDPHRAVTAENPYYYYYDRMNEQIIFYVTPTQPVEYVYYIYYHDSDRQALQVVQKPVKVAEVNNYYTRTKKSGGGGGCNAGTAGLVLLGAIPALAVIRRKKK